MSLPTIYRLKTRECGQFQSSDKIFKGSRSSKFSEEREEMFSEEFKVAFAT